MHSLDVGHLSKQSWTNKKACNVFGIAIGQTYENGDVTCDKLFNFYLPDDVSPMDISLPHWTPLSQIQSLKPHWIHWIPSSPYDCFWTCAFDGVPQNRNSHRHPRI